MQLVVDERNQALERLGTAVLPFLQQAGDLGSVGLFPHLKQLSPEDNAALQSLSKRALIHFPGRCRV